VQSTTDKPAQGAEASASVAKVPRARRAPRSRLLLLVYLTSLLILLTLGGGLAILASAHVSSSAIGASSTADRALVQALIADLEGALSDTSPTPTEVRHTHAVLERAVHDVGLIGIGLTAPDGQIVASAGDFGWPSPPLIDFGVDTPTAVVIDGSDGPRLVEAFPATVEGRVIAIVGIVRDGQPALATATAAQRDIALGTATGAAVLIVVLFLVFHGAQQRLDRQTEQLLESARRDPLTGLLNHGAVIAALADALEGDVQSPAAIALIDIDNFRSINDVHGHRLGDRALGEVASILLEASAPADAVGRTGPDEFLIVAPGADTSMLKARLEVMRQQLESVVLETDAGDGLPLTVSIGLGVAPLHGRTPTELLSAVAVTLGEAKSGGGNQLVVSRLSYAELAQERLNTFSVLDGLVRAIDTRDRYTRRHSEDVARYTLFLARHLGLDDEQRLALHHAALLHDVGKIAVPDAILRKPGPLTPEETEVMKQHVLLGGALVRDLADSAMIVDGVRYHHEWWDGTGYPEGLAGEEIPLLARIIAVADAFSAMTTSRPYRRALSRNVALARLAGGAGAQFDARLVDVFVLAMETHASPPRPSDARGPHLWLVSDPAA
jgi:diguanylate cyclase (GGDEF)-like protein/putative nucleotidyltransferase with HDIG domain